MGTVPGTHTGTLQEQPDNCASSAPAAALDGPPKPSESEDAEPTLASALVSEIVGVPDEGRWLVENLWASGAVGIVGGTPKTGKSWFTLELAVSVASGRAAFGEFAVQDAGTVVVFPAEDDPSATRDRVAGLARNKGVAFESLPLHLITERKVCLDEEPDRRGLRGLLRRLRPKLVVLDPLVRLHGGNENHSGQMAELLGFLRSLQREFQTAILLTHHISKRRGAKGAQLGQALRGSGELHAWGDSNVYLTRGEQGAIRVEVEHRAARAPDPFHVALRSEVERGAYLELIEVEDDEEDERGDRIPRVQGRARPPHPVQSTKPLTARILELLEIRGQALSQNDLRAALRVRNAALIEALRELAQRGAVERPGGKRLWVLAQDGKSEAVLTA